MASAKTRKETASLETLRRIQVVPDALGSAQILEQIAAIRDDLSRWLSREQFQPQILLRRAHVEKDARTQALLLADASRYYLIKRIVADCAKTLKSAAVLQETEDQ